MKTFTFIISITYFICLPFESIYSQDDNKRTLQVKGQIVNTIERVKNVEIIFILNGKINDTIIVTNGRYDILLPLESEIMLEFVAPEHYIKRIAFDTHVSSRKKIPYFDLKINLHQISLWELSEDDEDIMDFPVGFIKYDKTKKIFYDHNKKYSKIINEELMKRKKY